jgi:Zn-dependent protease with chaperone function/Zn-finger nucleic acid-binding protein
MQCPNCKNQNLIPYKTAQSTEIDLCPVCKGYWLEEGEILAFAKKPRILERILHASMQETFPSQKRSPATSNFMQSFIVEDTDITLDVCKETKGIWFDATEFAKLVQATKNELSVEKPFVYFKDKPSIKPPLTLVKLPHLALHSITTFIGLYALLAFLITLAVIYFDYSFIVGIYITTAFALIGVLTGPKLMDMSVFLFYSGHETDINNLTPVARSFIEKICKEKNIKYPKVFIINDDTPQAFTYGYTPNSARIVYSKGLEKILEKDEFETVLAHEFGHILHWDMALMTVIQLVPQISYMIYRSAIREDKKGASSKSSNGGSATAVHMYHIAVAIFAYVVYTVSYFTVLRFSRIREYHADRFGALYTQKPGALASALVKIGYGLAKKNMNRSQTVNALGIFDSNSVANFAVTSYAFHRSSKSDATDELEAVMRWDMHSPWAKWYEMGSTHPLIGKRLFKLSNISRHLGNKSFFDQVKNDDKCGWRFYADFLVYILPWLGLVPVLWYAVAMLLTQNHELIKYGFAYGLFIAAIGGIIKTSYSYKQDYFPQMSVAALLKHFAVSEVRPVPCRLQGTIIGRGVAGYIFSEDFTFQDNTGILFLDYKQPSELWESFFAMFKAQKYIGKEVVVQGWYRRSPIPKLEVLHIETTDKTLSSYSYYKNITLTSNFLLALFSGIWIMSLL